MTAPAVRIDAATTVGDFTVRAAFEAGPGITALFGPSGAGKSVTLATIAGLLRPATGQVVLRGELVADAERRIHVPSQARRVGMVFQDAALLPHRSPLDNVAFAVDRDKDRHARRERARELLAQVHAEQLADARTPSLSGGEQQRVAVARALAGSAPLLLLDEPFSALDQPTRVSLRRLVRELVDETGVAAVLVTHDLADITHLADRVVRFEPGRSVETVELDGGDPARVARVLGLGG